MQDLLDSNQTEIFQKMLNNNNLFITGRAGTGKSFLISSFYNLIKGSKNVGITSLTGISALVVNGTTLHSFLGILLGKGTTEQLFRRIRHHPVIYKRWRELETLVIDEVSMLSPHLFDKLEELARKIRKNDKPFGDIQVILVGDLLQLPVIETDKFVFESQSWNRMKFEVCYLTKIYRQDDVEFQKCLDEVRIGNLSKRSKMILNNRSNKPIVNDYKIKPTKLFSNNVDVDIINDEELDKLSGDVYEYKSEINIFKKGLDKNKIKLPCRAPQILKLSEGAQVVLVYNLDIIGGLVNGSRGVVTKFIEDIPEVMFMNGITQTISFLTWDIYGKEHNKIATYTQIPLKLAWASTIHSTQGATLDCVEVDLQNVFEYGQAYVALSRARNLQGLSIKNLDFRKIKAHPKAIYFYKSIKQVENKCNKYINKEKKIQPAG